MTDTVLYSLADDVATISLNRPEKRNALDLATLSGLKSAFERAPSDGARAILLRAEGLGFCSGADLTSSDGLSGNLGDKLQNHYEPVIRAMNAAPIPIICAVQGAAAGAGCALALAADLVVADAQAYFLLAFANIGLVPDMGATWLVSKAVGRARAMEMALLGERISADQALSWGLINRVVEPDTLQQSALDLAKNLANRPTLALGMIRSAINAALDVDLETTFATEARNQTKAGHSEDAKEAVIAFVEKRKPVFKGK